MHDFPFPVAPTSKWDGATWTTMMLPMTKTSDLNLAKVCKPSTLTLFARFVAFVFSALSARLLFTGNIASSLAFSAALFALSVD
jgi:hypothetical protein